MLTLTVCAVRGHHGRIWGKPESEGTAIYNFSMLAVQESLPPIAIVARCGVGVRYPICQEAGEARDVFSGANVISFLPLLRTTLSNVRSNDRGARRGRKCRYTPQIVYKVVICPRGNLPYIQITSIVLPYEALSILSQNLSGKCWFLNQLLRYWCHKKPLLLLFH